MSSEAAKIIDLYERHARNWDKDRGRDLFEKAWLDQFLNLLPPGGSILDVGCGSGEPIARYFLERGYEITGVDSSPTLIDICKRRFPMQRWMITDMRELCLRGRFNGIIAWDSFFHLCPEDQRRMFPTFRAHSAPNAALLFTSSPTGGEAISQYRGEPLYHGSLDPAEYRDLVDQHGYAVVSYVAQDATCGNHTIWLAQLGIGRSRTVRTILGSKMAWCRRD